MKITVQDYRKTQPKHSKAKKGHGWTKLERIEMDCIWVNLKKKGPPFFKFMSVHIKISFTQRENHSHTESEEAQPLSFSFSFAFAFCSAFSFHFHFSFYCTNIFFSFHLPLHSLCVFIPVSLFLFIALRLRYVMPFWF